MRIARPGRREHFSDAQAGVEASKRRSGRRNGSRMDEARALVLPSALSRRAAVLRGSPACDKQPVGPPASCHTLSPESARSLPLYQCGDAARRKTNPRQSPCRLANCCVNPSGGRHTRCWDSGADALPLPALRSYDVEQLLVERRCSPHQRGATQSSPQISCSWGLFFRRPPSGTAL
jgi:hypothetical protein